MGDSLALAQQVMTTNADIILFCGVHFMCETEKILNPEKQVILPDINAGCSLAESAPQNYLRHGLIPIILVPPLLLFILLLNQLKIILLLPLNQV